MSANRNHRYWLEKIAHRKTGYPMATLACYGPDDTRASRVVVGVFRSPSQKESAVLSQAIFELSEGLCLTKNPASISGEGFTRSPAA